MMNSQNHLPPEDQVPPANQPSTQPVMPDEAAADPSRQATVVAAKALLHEIKTHNKAGRPVMRIHEPRQRFETGALLRVLPEEVVADGGVIYLLCADHPDLYVRKIDVSVSEG
jgi:hypothetical protein